MERRSTKVGTDRLVVEYDVESKRSAQVWDDAARLALEGWRMLSVDSRVTAFRAGWLQAGQPLDLCITVLYGRVETPGT
jgi:hypothetical protein